MTEKQVWRQRRAGGVQPPSGNIASRRGGKLTINRGIEIRQENSYFQQLKNVVLQSYFLHFTLKN